MAEFDLSQPTVAYPTTLSDRLSVLGAPSFYELRLPSLRVGDSLLERFSPKNSSLPLQYGQAGSPPAGQGGQGGPPAGGRPKVDGPGIPPLYGVTFNQFTPISGQTRDLFGSRWIGFGPGLSPVYGERVLRLRPDAVVLIQDQDVNGFNNEAAVIGIGGQFRYAFDRQVTIKRDGDVVRVRFKDFSPWASIGARLTYVKLRVPSLNIRADELTYSITASLGTSITKNAYLAVRYLYIPQVAGIDLRGTTFEVGVRF